MQLILSLSPLLAQETAGICFVEKPFKETLAQAQTENKLVLWIAILRGVAFAK